jgi:hypothetical protein
MSLERTSMTLLLMILLLGWRHEAAGPCEAAVSNRTQQDVRTISRALYGGDADTVLKYTHPKVVQLQGGEAAAHQRLQAAIQTMKNMKIESLTFPAAPTCLNGGNRRFAIVPTLSVLVRDGQRVESLNYQLGVLEPGEAEWTYVEGSRMNAATVQILFPGFPKDYTFPPIYRKRL